MEGLWPNANNDVLAVSLFLHDRFSEGLNHDFFVSCWECIGVGLCEQAGFGFEVDCSEHLVVASPIKVVSSVVPWQEVSLASFVLISIKHLA